MIPANATPLLLVLLLIVLLACGLGTLVWGRRLPREGDWLSATGLTALAAGLGISLAALLDSGLQARIWSRGWIWPRDEAGAIRVGVIEDPLGITMSALAIVLAATALFNRGPLGDERRRERYFASLAIAVSGVSLAWVSLTPWFAFIGIGLTVLAGFFSIGARWEDESEAAIGTRFGWERSSGLLLAILGATVLAGARGALGFGHGELWNAQPGAHPLADSVGAGLLLTGVFIQLQAFPLLGPLAGWLASATEAPAVFRILLTQVFPSFAAFALLVRVEPQLRAIGAFPVCGWVAAAAAVPTLASGLMQSQWRAVAAFWVSSGGCMALAALAFAGPWAGLAILLGSALGGVALAGGGSALEAGGSTSNSNRKRAGWSKGAAFAGAAVGTGVIGFLPAAGGLRWALAATREPLEAAAVVILFFFLSLLGWKAAWAVHRSRGFTQSPWYSVLSPLLPIFLSAAAVWTGVMSGGAIPGDPDRVGKSVFALFFGTGEQAGDLVTASWLFWTPVSIGLIAAAWMGTRKQDPWARLARGAPRFTAFVAGGYGIDGAVDRVRGGVLWFGRALVTVVDHGAWGEWVPALLSAVLDHGTAAVARADSRTSGKMGVALGRAVNIPAKVLQLVQTGDVQWYLFFAVGSGIALLLHFLPV